MKTPVAPTCKELWTTKVSEGFNAMALATLFRPQGLSLITGCEDGMVRIHDISAQHLERKPQICRTHLYPVTSSSGNGYSMSQTVLMKTVLETKSGPIQCLRVHDITRFYHNDLIVGDSCGLLTVFCNRQILSRQSLSSDSIVCITVVEDNGGVPVIVCSNDSGVITGVQPTTELWRINLNSLSNKNPSLMVKILCLQAVYLTDTTGNRRQFLLASDNAKRIHVICNGTVVSSLIAPSNITAMTQGRFVTPNKLSLPAGNSTPLENEQVALGASNGAVYILHNFNVTQDDYVNAKCPITSLCTLPQPDSTTDLLLCAGHFSSLHIYRDGRLLTEYMTSDWVSNIALADIDEDGTVEIVIGCMDSTVVALKV